MFFFQAEKAFADSKNEAELEHLNITECLNKLKEINFAGNRIKSYADSCAEKKLNELRKNIEKVENQLDEIDQAQDEADDCINNTEDIIQVAKALGCTTSVSKINQIFIILISK